MTSTARLACLLLASACVALASHPATAHPPLPPGCDVATPKDCLYLPAQTYPNPGEIRTVLIDPARNNYQIPILIRHPVGAAGRRPVVIWNHGGGPRAGGRELNAEYGTALAEAGYVVIHPSRMPISDATPYLAECAATGISDPQLCAAWIAMYRFNVESVRFIVSALPALTQAFPALHGQLDPRKIIVAGFSAGNAATQSMAGALQQWLDGGPVYNNRYTRPIAFIAAAPSGPMQAGYEQGFQWARNAASPNPDFYRTSFDTIDTRPFLFISGEGDTNSKPSHERAMAFLRSRGGNKYLSWSSNTTAVHGTSGAEQCDTPTRQMHCDAYKNLAVAFLDAHVVQRPEAIDWLASDAYQTLTEGVVSLFRK